MIRTAFVGAVDSGKSSLLGQLMITTENVLPDRVMEARSALTRAWADGQRGDATTLAWLVDGLRAERSVGATVDVAYRHLQLFGHRVVVQDCPGHGELSGAIFTGLSTADTVVVVVDATLGITDIARWHLQLVRMLAPRLVIVAVNKMDLRGWSLAVVTELGDQARAALGGVTEVIVMPMSAITGQGVDDLAQVITDGPQPPVGPLRAVVQGVARRGGTDLTYVTRVGGHLSSNQQILVTPPAPDAARETLCGLVSGAGTALRLELPHLPEHARRGAVLSDVDEPTPRMVSTLTGPTVWFHPRPARAQDPLIVWVGTAEVPGRTRSELRFGQIAAGEVILDQAIPADPYHVNRITGSARLLDPNTRRVVGAMTLEG